MRLVVEVPDKTLARFKAAVESQNRTQADVIRTAIDAYIESVQKSKGDNHSPSKGQSEQPVA